MFEKLKITIQENISACEDQEFFPDKLIGYALMMDLAEQMSILSTALRPPPMPIIRQESEHTGIMLAFMLDPETAKQLAIPGGEAPDGLHITLCFLGNVDEFTAEIEHLKATVAKFAAGSIPLGGHVGGIGRFTPSDSSDHLSPIIALVNIPKLQKQRQRLTELLDSAGVFIANDFDFLPHITLAYVTPSSPMPIQNVPPVKLTFDTLWLCIGDERIPYKLGKQEESQDNLELFDGRGNNITEDTRARLHVACLPPDEDDWWRGLRVYDRAGNDITREAKMQLKKELAATEEYMKLVDLHEETNLELETKEYPLSKIFPRMKLSQEEQNAPDIFKSALKDIVITEITQYYLYYKFSGHITDGIAQCYLEAQRYAYNKAMTTVGIKVAQEGIIGRIASGIKTTATQAFDWAKEQVASIVSTLQTAYDTFVADLLGDGLDIDAEIERFLSDYAGWKSEQVVNVVWQTGLDAGTNAAITDILESSDALTNVANVRVRVLPGESSSDYCKEFAGNDYSLDEYKALGIAWPFHPSCPHHAEIQVRDDANT